MINDVANEGWVAKLKALPSDEQADMLAAAVKLLQHPEAISTPLESEAHVLAEKAYAALGTSLVS